VVDIALEALELQQAADGVLVARLSRPESVNVMARTMFREMADLGRRLDTDQRARALIVTGAGTAFCAGYDLTDAEEISEMTAMDFLDLQESAARAAAGLARDSEILVNEAEAWRSL
jgi:enoyl-CoA hydratase/carnithine racemase